eukprot:372198-Amorphochlora_amoeboformis.AAC.1
MLELELVKDLQVLHGPYSQNLSAIPNSPDTVDCVLPAKNGPNEKNAYDEYSIEPSRARVLGATSGVKLREYNPGITKGSPGDSPKTRSPNWTSPGQHPNGATVTRPSGLALCHYPFGRSENISSELKSTRNKGLSDTLLKAIQHSFAYKFRYIPRGFFIRRGSFV